MHERIINYLTLNWLFKLPFSLLTHSLFPTPMPMLIADLKPVTLSYLCKTGTNTPQYWAQFTHQRKLQKIRICDIKRSVSVFSQLSQIRITANPRNCKEMIKMQNLYNDIKNTVLTLSQMNKITNLILQRTKIRNATKNVHPSVKWRKTKMKGM